MTSDPPAVTEAPVVTGPPLHGSPARIAGVDGCPGGWVVASADLTEPVLTGLAVERVESLDGAVELVRRGLLAALAIDMPIGLLDEHPRKADVDARRLLGPRRSSIFPTPLRTVLEASDYVDAGERSRAISGKGLSKQAWNLVPKIRQLDALIDPSDQPSIAEAHPECAFLRLQGDVPLDHPKSTEVGRALRVGLLRASRQFDPSELDHALASSAAPLVDTLDALSLLITARHMAFGSDRRLGGEQTDHRGRKAEIVY